MRRWKLYFSYDHLLERLQAVARPFAEAAEALVAGTDSAGLRPRLDACLETVAVGQLDVEQVDVARKMLSVLDDVIEDDDCSLSVRLDTLLFAKDAAVRAHLRELPEAP